MCCVALRQLTRHVLGHTQDIHLLYYICVLGICVASNKDNIELPVCMCSIVCWCMSQYRTICLISYGRYIFFCFGSARRSSNEEQVVMKLPMGIIQTMVTSQLCVNQHYTEIKIATHKTPKMVLFAAIHHRCCHFVHSNNVIWQSLPSGLSISQWK